MQEEMSLRIPLVSPILPFTVVILAKYGKV